MGKVNSEKHHINGLQKRQLLSFNWGSGDAKKNSDYESLLSIGWKGDGAGGPSGIEKMIILRGNMRRKGRRGEKGGRESTSGVKESGYLSKNRSEANQSALFYRVEQIVHE